MQRLGERATDRRARRWFWPLVIVALMGLPLATTATAVAQAGPVVVINEFLASNQNGLIDNTGETEDWIELRNTSNAAVDLNGWVLRAGDDEHVFDSLLLQADELLVIFASGDPDRTTPDELHVDFKLSAGGELLTLSDSAGVVSTPAWPAPGYPAQVADDSFGIASGGQVRYFLNPTPGAPNGGGVGGRVQPVTFSLEHGYYVGPQQLTLDTPTAGATIRFTLDGSVPTNSNGTALSPGDSITVSESSVVRARAFRSGWASSTLEARTYLFVADIVAQSTNPPPGWPADNSVNSMRAFYGMEPGLSNAQKTRVRNALTAIPTFSLSTDLANLFDPDTGIWANPLERGSGWERPVSIELIDPTGAEEGFEINGGFRVRGNSSRQPSNFKHSMRLVFDDTYGDGELEYPLFGDEGVDEFESVDLKTAQSWSWQRPSARLESRGPEATWLRDVWNRDSQGAMGQPYARSRFVHLFFNGQYWGLYMTEERISNQYGSQYTGGDESDFDVIKRNTGGSLATSIDVEAQDGTPDDWLSLWPMVQDHRLTDAEWSVFKTEVDLVNLADYYLLMFYGGDSDGTPRYTKDMSNNWLAFRNRSRVGEAARWIFMDRDSESALCTNVNAARPPDWDPTPPWNLDGGIGNYLPEEFFLAPAWLFEAALTQPEFVRIFKDRVHSHMIDPDGALTVGASLARLNERAATVDLAIDAESARWGDTWVTPALGRSHWEQAVDTVRDCFQLRRNVVSQYLDADGLWPDAPAPIIEPAEGAVAYGTDVTITGDGPVWVTTDGSDPASANGDPSPSAFLRAGAIRITEGTTIKARRALGGGEWSPLAEHAFTIGSLDGPRRLLVNEYNAVSGSKYLGGGTAADVANGSDPTFGRVAGNGGDWFELVVVEDGLDIGGWSVELAHRVDGIREISAQLTFVDDPVLSDLRAGTLITISESVADDVSYSPIAGDWHLNLQANSNGDGAYITAASQENFAIDNDDTQITILDGDDVVDSLPTGEGVITGLGVGSTEVFKLETAPHGAIEPTDDGYNSGTSSTWGLPNRFGAGAEVQDFSSLDHGSDPDCDGEWTLLDALLLARYNSGALQEGSCAAVAAAGVVNVLPGDLNADGAVDPVDIGVLLGCLAQHDGGPLPDCP